MVIITTEIKNAIKAGNLDFIKFAHQNGVVVNDTYESILQNSAEHGHVHIIKWALSTFDFSEERADHNIGQGAGLGGRLQAVEFAMSRSKCCRESICGGAIYGGHLEILKSVNQFNWDKFETEDVAENNHGRNLEVLEWCMKQNPSVVAHECKQRCIGYWAIFNGFNTDFLDGIRSMGLIPEDGMCQNAADVGDLSHMKWARRNGFSWDSKVSAAAAHLGKADMLMYVIENGCPWDESLFQKVQLDEDNYPEGKSSEIPIALKWARAYGK